MLFSTSPSRTRAAGGLSALQKNRQRTPNELLSFSLSEFRNVSENQASRLRDLRGNGMLSDDIRSAEA